MGEVKMRIFSGFALLAFAAATAIAPAANDPVAQPAAAEKGIVEKEVDKIMAKYPQHAGMAEMMTDLFKSVVNAEKIKAIENEAKKAKRKAWAAKAGNWWKNKKNKGPGSPKSPKSGSGKPPSPKFSSGKSAGGSQGGQQGGP